MSSCGSPKNSVPPPSSSWTSWRSSTPIVDEATPPIPVSSALPVLGGEEREQRAQVGEVEERQALLVGVAEDERQALLLRLVRLQHLAEQQRPEVGDGRADRDARADAAEREVLDRERRRREGLAELLPPVGGDAARAAGLGEPGEVALHVGGEDGHAGVGELLGDPLEALRLAGAGRAGDQAVAVHHPQRHLDDAPSARPCRRGRPCRARASSPWVA